MSRYFISVKSRCDHHDTRRVAGQWPLEVSVTNGYTTDSSSRSHRNVGCAILQLHLAVLVAGKVQIDSSERNPSLRERGNGDRELDQRSSADVDHGDESEGIDNRDGVIDSHADSKCNSRQERRSEEEHYCVDDLVPVELAQQRNLLGANLLDAECERFFPSVKLHDTNPLQRLGRDFHTFVDHSQKIVLNPCNGIAQLHRYNADNDQSDSSTRCRVKVEEKPDEYNGNDETHGSDHKPRTLHHHSEYTFGINTHECQHLAC
ncbi:hypothetical protein PPTG_25023 [Phytophthora nicotianae INRA-310]|uniref:Uncharacterized protein n=1 Tax=Phytophthora nicotianae (strain INRA-310) TaxID=761204 RepID=W2P9H3_PHYN3|nr:hypothetical protein PPTG_25023 [Phytophthora nicotianae INRA-310]ETM97290.1 hypothetical protein PPTG_25023 [Phytophthora nicotianae INRA-310]